MNNSTYNGHRIGGQHWAPPSNADDVIHISDEEPPQSMMTRPLNYYNQSHNTFGRAPFPPSYHSHPPPANIHQPAAMDSVSSKLEDKFLGFQPLLPNTSPHGFPPLPFGGGRIPPPVSHHVEPRPHHTQHFTHHSPIGAPSHTRTTHDYPHPPFTPSRQNRQSEYPSYSAQEDPYPPRHHATLDYTEIQERRRPEGMSYQYDHSSYPPPSYPQHYNQRYTDDSPNVRGGYTPTSAYSGPPHGPFGQYPQIPGPPSDLLEELRSVSNPSMRSTPSQPPPYNVNKPMNNQQAKPRPQQQQMMMTKGLTASDMIPEMTERKRRGTKKINGIPNTELIPTMATPAQKVVKPKRTPAQNRKQPKNAVAKARPDMQNDVSTPSPTGGITGAKQVKPARKSKGNTKVVQKPPTPRNQRRSTLRSRSDQKKFNESMNDDERANGDMKGQYYGDDRGDGDVAYDSDESTTSSTDSSIVATVPLVTRNSDNFCFASNAIHILSETVDMVRQCHDFIETEVRGRVNRDVVAPKEETKPEPVKEDNDTMVDDEQKPTSDTSTTSIIDLSIYNCVMFNEKHKQKKIEKQKTPGTPSSESKRPIKRPRRKPVVNHQPVRVSSGIRKSKLKKGPGLDIYEVLCATQLTKVSDSEMERELLSDESSLLLKEAVVKQRENTVALMKAEKAPEFVPSVRYFLTQGNEVEIGTTTGMIWKDRPSDHEGAMLKQLQEQLQDDGMGNRFNNMGDYIQQNISLRTKGLIYKLNTQRVATDVLTLKRKDIVTDMKLILGTSGSTGTPTGTSSSLNKKDSPTEVNKNPTNGTSNNGSKRLMDDMFDYDDVYRRGRPRRRIDGNLTEAPLTSPKRTSTRNRKETRRIVEESDQGVESSASINGDEEHVDSTENDQDSDSANYNLRKRKASTRRSARVQKRQKIDDVKTVGRKKKEEEANEEKGDSNDSMESRTEIRYEEEENEEHNDQTAFVKKEEDVNHEESREVDNGSPSLTDAELLASARAYNTRSSERRLMTKLKQLDETTEAPVPVHTPTRRRINRNNLTNLTINNNPSPPKETQKTPSPTVPDDTPTTPETYANEPPEDEGTMDTHFEHPANVEIVPTLTMTVCDK
jgi:hypothetical protein